MEHNLKKKSQEVENLLKTFRKRNEEYETLLNASLKVNTRLHKKKQEKINQIRDKEKKKFNRKLQDFLKKKHPQKLKASPKKSKSGFLNLIKESLRFGKSPSPEPVKKKENQRESNYDIKEDTEFLENSDDDQDSNFDIAEFKDAKAWRSKYKKPSQEFSMDNFSPIETNHRSSKFKLKNLSRISSRKESKRGSTDKKRTSNFEFESRIINSKKIPNLLFEDSEMKLKSDVLYTPNPDMFMKEDSSPRSKDSFKKASRFRPKHRFND